MPALSRPMSTPARGPGGLKEGVAYGQGHERALLWQRPLCRAVPGALAASDSVALAGMVVDHIAGNSLNNRRSNRRICTPFENAQNQHRPKRGQSRFVGVDRVGDKWEATVGHRGRSHYVGRFEDEEEAAEA